MIGSEEDAYDVLSYPRTSFDFHGGSRRVFHFGDVVYKVEKYAGINAREYAKYKSLLNTKLPENVRIPETHLYNVGGKDVIAMQFIKGQEMASCWCIEGREDHQPDCLPKSMEPAIQKVINDTGGANVILSEVDGFYYVIDLEC